MKPLYVDHISWTQTTITHVHRKGKMVPCPPRVVWSKTVHRVYL